MYLGGVAILVWTVELGVLAHPICMDSRLETAKARDESLRISRSKRFKARSDRLARLREMRPSSQVDQDYEEKTRALISAIRAFTNTDTVMDTRMSADTLFQTSLRCLKESSQEAKDTTKMVGEALRLITELNVFLDSW